MVIFNVYFPGELIAILYKKTLKKKQQQNNISDVNIK